jgi:23S rRNA (cytosine1962-C5)-methyltransferase
MNLKKAVINSKGLKRARSGHPWVFRSDLVSTDAEDGAVVHVSDPSGRPAGTAFYSEASQIALRFLDGRHVEPYAEFFTGRLDKAAALRDRLYGGAATRETPPSGVRIFFGESDGIPALIIDRYGPVAVIQTLCTGAESIKDMVTGWCERLPGIDAVVERNDPKVRTYEKLPQITGTLVGEVPRDLAIEEGGVLLDVDVLKGQKTGAFLDQRDNRDLVAARAHGRVLDAFCYHGWFSLRAAGNAGEVISLDASLDAIKAVERNASRLGLDRIKPVEGNVFDYMRECDLRGERFDTIILDPPAFAKNRDAIDAARRGYKEINLRAMKLLNPGGLLFTFSCSYHMGERLFYETISEAATDSGRPVVLERRLSQSLDHPILLSFPESSYLKGYLLRIG